MANPCLEILPGVVTRLRFVQRDKSPAALKKVIAASDDVDADEVLIHPKRRVVEAVAFFSPGRRRWQTVDPAVKEDFASLAQLDCGDFSVVNRTEKQMRFG